MGSKSSRVQTAEAVSAKILIEFGSLIVRSRIYNLLKDEVLKLNMRKNFMTVPAAFRELEKLEIVRINGGVYQLDHAVTRNQETILKAFGIDEDEVNKKIAQIAETLGNANQRGKEEDTQEEDDDAEA